MRRAAAIAAITAAFVTGASVPAAHARMRVWIFRNTCLVTGYLPGGIPYETVVPC